MWDLGNIVSHLFCPIVCAVHTHGAELYLKDIKVLLLSSSGFTVS